MVFCECVFVDGLLSEIENVNCDFEFYTCGDLCHGYYYPQPYPTAAPTFYFNCIGNGMPGNLAFEVGDDTNNESVCNN